MAVSRKKLTFLQRVAAGDFKNMRYPKLLRTFKAAGAYVHPNESGAVVKFGDMRINFHDPKTSNERYKAKSKKMPEGSAELAESILEGMHAESYA